MTGEEKAIADPPAATSPVQQSSANPAATVFGAVLPSSRPTEAPATENSPAPQASGGLPGIATAAAAAAIDPAANSPNSITSAPSNALKSEAPAPAIASGPGNTDPQLLQSDNPQYQQHQPQPVRTGSISERLSATTPTTPGFAPNTTTPNTPFSPSSSSGRAKHSCPHCHQTFTRHHNLKSHLLTHSQEKPFSCNQCNARFRRLHDLKRHSKLHTGERPHVCHKCGRRFARGDALARHARGEGGCAGRRSSMGGILNEDSSIISNMGSGDAEDGMGLEHPIGDDDGDIDMFRTSSGGEEGADDIAKRRASLPSIRTTDIHSGQHQLGPQRTPITPASAYPQHHQHNTYSPLGASGNRTGSISGLSPGSAALFPPHSMHPVYKPNTTTSTSPSVQATTLSTTPTIPGSAIQSSTGQQSILSPHGVLTDSPRAVSPAVLPNQPDTTRERTPSLGSGFLASFSPQQTSREGLTAPHTQSHQQQPATSPQQQNSSPSQQSSTTNITANGPAPQANMGSLGPANGGAHGNNLFSAGWEGVWSYVRNLEGRVQQLEEKVVLMEGKLAANAPQQAAGTS
ncbi:hypothetical protein RUND412_010914 [Rhizina undulata]